MVQVNDLTHTKESQEVTENEPHQPTRNTLRIGGGMHVFTYETIGHSIGPIDHGLGSQVKPRSAKSNLVHFEEMDKPTWWTSNGIERRVTRGVPSLVMPDTWSIFIYQRDARDTITLPMRIPRPIISGEVFLGGFRKPFMGVWALAFRAETPIRYQHATGYARRSSPTDLIQLVDIMYDYNFNQIPKALKEGRKQVDVDYIAPLDRNRKTASVLVPQQVNAQQFGTSTTENFPDDLGTRMMYDKIKSAFSKVSNGGELIVQFWAPVTSGNGRVLSTSGQPFTVIKDEKQHGDRHSMTMISSPPTNAFLNRLPEEVLDKKNHREGSLMRYASDCGLWTSYTLPIGCPSQYYSSCISVVECSSISSINLEIVNTINRALEQVDLNVYNVQDRIPYNEYDEACDMVILKMGEELVVETLQDYQPRFCENISQLSTDKLMAWVSTDDVAYSGFTICMSIDTGEFNCAFEFIWHQNSNYVLLLEALLLTLKRCLPRFNFASDAELGDGLHVIDVDNSRE
ncbi:hypothetical protein Tco_0802232 [Tanacetum coccineum]|uniref:Uncharacterized protein n=1 Tax=Tanacetum coccineum TaxID=301880 RepID=A0ABQ4ZY79_9ASTR